MKTYQYIIIGGGMTGSAAAMEIRKNDPKGTIAIFSEENYEPYNRPPLTKSLWAGKKIEDITRPMDQYNIDLFLNNRVQKVNPGGKTIMDKNGEEYQYEKLLIATGGRPIMLPSVPDGVVFYRTLDDYKMVQDLAQSKDNFCVIGGGFIGSEIAAALNKQGKQVTMIFPEVGISGLRFPEDLAKFLNDYYQEKGVRVLDGYLVDAISKQGDKFEIGYKNLNEENLIKETFDGVIVGIGIKPNTDLAESAGLEIADGIVVNEYLQTSDPDILAAGDVANFMNAGLGKRVRVEHEDNANTMGKVAGKNMSAEMQKYDHFPFFYSDLFDLGYEAVGEMDQALDIYEDWVEEYRKGTIYYLDQGKIRGIIFWDLWGQVNQGIKLITEGKIYKKPDLKGMFS